MKRGILAMAALLLLTPADGANAQSGGAPGEPAVGSAETGARIQACAKLLPLGSPKIEANYHLELNPDATVRVATLLDADKLGGPAYRAAAECMRKAFLEGGSLNLPKEKYDEWKSVTVAIQIAPQP